MGLKRLSFIFGLSIAVSTALPQLVPSSQSAALPIIQPPPDAPPPTVSNGTNTAAPVNGMAESGTESSTTDNITTTESYTVTDGNVTENVEYKDTYPLDGGNDYNESVTDLPSSTTPPETPSSSNAPLPTSAPPADPRNAGQVRSGLTTSGFLSPSSWSSTLANLLLIVTSVGVIGYLLYIYYSI